MYRDDPGVEVVAFTATQIPDIDGRTYPPELAGPLGEAMARAAAAGSPVTAAAPAPATAAPHKP